MTYQPGTHLLVVRTLATGRVVRFSGTVIEDHGHGLSWRDDTAGHRHLATDPAQLAKHGITQTITVG